ncbi:MAG: hypothetical protein ACOX3E_13485 [Desulfomonilia bacterium]|jgi:Ni,Fe-hydrogenase III large subunit|uniref:Uncharacterized protein n=1 Tax=anaerobic digester metagenome TaxID=1263854 RepID=A0A485M243_9ZZZZ|nr:hypothetical protein [Pseudomonadota bacterium]HON37310.1 hypothetical protein [Deltaproteobacteria bacterium]HRS56187.1 hypothetical protein [Desulfomonilia bacterium]HPD21423.1 hypothetical protein [Deltaproteobacteria bacterium]HPX18406.1 hypothetical protein [Deltaproteobacteria bacterium]
MFSVDLTAEEKDVLHNMLSNYVSDLRMEIADTDRQDFREMIKKQKEILQKIIDALEK